MSEFDVEAFLHTTTSDAGDTEYPLIPALEYQATIKDVAVRQAKQYTILDIMYAIHDDGSLKEITHMDENVVRQSLFLDLTPTGGLDMTPGKNVKLNRVREAVGQNVPGQTWSIASLKGAGPVVIAVEHREAQAKNPGEKARTFTDVARVTKLS